MRGFVLALLAPWLMGATAPTPDETFYWPGPLAEQRIMFAGAHPDDEWGVAPLLAEACIDGGAKCHFVVASEARSFGCLLTLELRDAEACSRIRRAEMQESAALFGASLEFFGWEDFFYGFNQAGVDKTISDWAAAAGGHDALVARLVTVLQQHRPTMVFTFDPRHGSTCHPGHRATARLVIEAIERLPDTDRPQLWLEQTDNIDSRDPTVAAANKQAGYVAWPDAGAVQWFDADKRLSNGRRAYDYVSAVRKLHASQYPDEASGKLTPYATPELRRVPLQRYAGSVSGDFCTPLKIELPTFDIPGNRTRFGLEE